MNWTPRVTVATVIEIEQRFLMVEERPEGVSVFNQPAGHLEAGESLLEAAVRETLEETAYRVTPTALIGVYRWTHEASDRTYIRFCFTGDCEADPLDRALDPDILARHWLTRSELAACNLRSPMVRHCIDDYLKGCRYPLELLNEVR